MNDFDLCKKVSDTLPPLFTCSPAPVEGVRVRTPLLYPDGGVVDVYVLDRGAHFTVTDFGDALGWLGLQSISRQRSPKQQLLVRDVCQSLRIQLLHDQLVLNEVKHEDIGEAVLRVAQAVIRVSDVWFTLRSQSLQSTAEEVDEWLHEKQIPFERAVERQGRSSRTWIVDFETHTNSQSHWIFLLSTGSRGAVRRLTEHVLASCVDLNHLKTDMDGIAFVSLFDDTVDVWRAEDFNLVSELSQLALWSRPDEFERILRTSSVFSQQ